MRSWIQIARPAAHIRDRPPSALPHHIISFAPSHDARVPPTSSRRGALLVIHTVQNSERWKAPRSNVQGARGQIRAPRGSTKRVSQNCFVRWWRKMKPIFVLSMPLCALLGLAGCDYSPGPPNFVTERDSSFIVTCVPSACAQRATAICQAQGYSRYDILERTRGDDLGEGGAIVVQCKKS